MVTKGSKHSKKSIKEEKDTNTLSACFLNLGITTEAKNGNVPDIDGTIEIKDPEGEISTNLRLEYQLKSFVKNSYQKVSIPRKMLVRAKEALNPVLVCAVDDYGSLHYSYLDKKFCNTEITNTNQTKNLTILLRNKINSNPSEEEVLSHRKTLIRICEFHKNKYNDQAINTFIKNFDLSFNIDNTDLALEKIANLKSLAFFRSDDGEYPIQNFIFNNVDKLLNIKLTHYEDTFQKEIIDLVLLYSYDEPSKVLDVILNSLNIDNVKETNKVKLRKELLDLSKHNYQRLSFYGLTVFNKLLELTKNKKINDYSLISELYINLLDLDYSGAIPTEDDRAITFHRGALNYSEQLKKLRLSALVDLKLFYDDAKNIEDKIKILTALGKVFSRHDNLTSEDNEKKLNKMLNNEAKLVSDFLCKIVIPENKNNYEVLIEIEKFTFYSNQKKIKKNISELGKEYELYSLFTVDMWRYRDINNKYLDISKIWLEDIKKCSAQLKEKNIWDILIKVSERKIEKNQEVLQQINIGCQYIGKEIITANNKNLSKIKSPLVLCPIINGLITSNRKVNLHFDYSVFYTLGALRFDSETNNTNIDFIYEINKNDISNLDNSLFLYSFEGLLNFNRKVDKKIFKEIFFCYLKVSEEKNLENIFCSTLDLLFVRGILEIDFFNKNELKSILNIYRKISSISHGLYGGFLEKLLVKDPQLFVDLISKRIKFKPNKKTSVYYDSVPDDLKIPEIVKDKFINGITKLLISYFDSTKDNAEQYLPYEIGELIKFADLSLIDEYIISNIDNKNLLEVLFDRGIGSEKITVLLVEKGLTELAKKRLYQYMSYGYVYSENQKVLIEKQIERLKELKKKVTKNKQLISSVIIDLEKYALNLQEDTF